ncbi:Pyridine nucleotide-disulphide oxidoreductase [Noviherbaspirillum humi]|uniref:Pyridine nucleotide-disulphide oxidoreductase n=1 Tax=Noviherbaspirillum humi TaxID=1688639 RepID=A0A239DGQ9_9BURK|nr:FAD-dependent oxidoreductase [Noviherbaspirillum humi]SNS31081.1 Pyridine nucleotide-disulphide oxidoreductase [Noviherbaspirillum humi]
MRHLILGTGPAGITAAETIRQHAPDDEIILVGDELEPPYARARLPQWLSGAIGEQDLRQRTHPDHFRRLGIRLRLGRARRIQTQANSVLFEDGGKLPYDRLLIATGARPVAPVITGLRSPGVHACWTMQDARDILARLRLRPRARVVLIGAGYIGCVLMQALAARGVELTVVEKGMRMMPHLIGEGASRVVRQWCQTKGIRVVTGTRVRAIAASSDGTQLPVPPSAPLAAWLSSGEVVQADVIIHATGHAPNTAFLQESGIRCASGILVDDRMQTSVPGIFAAGDCAEVFDSELGRTVISAMQWNAVEQARCAGLNMTGRHATQHRVRQVDMMELLGLPLASFGHWRGVSGGQWVEMSDERNFRYLRLEFGKDVLVGSNAVGLSDHAGVLRELIQRRIALGEWKDRLLHDPSLLADAYRACTGQRQSHAR